MAGWFDLLVKGGTVATAGGFTIADVGVRSGRIAAIGTFGASDADEVLDCRNLHVLPGVIDTQVHFREPGVVHKEDLETGTAAAAAGGVTAIFEMPNTKPATATAEALDQKLTAARGRTWCDHAFFVGATPDNADALAALERLPGCCGVKVFMGSSTGDLLVARDEILAQVLSSGSRRVAVHAEDEQRLIERRSLLSRPDHPRRHPEWRDRDTALRATQRLLALAVASGRRVHVLHITTGAEMALLARHKAVATVEVTPQHLTLAGPDCYERLGTLAQMNPPIRDEAERTALWHAVADGTVDVIGSDHAPHTAEEKAGSYPDTPSGMPGVQTLLPIMLDHVNAGRLTLQRLVDLTSAGPHRIYGIAGKGRIAAGYDADLTIVDLKARRTIENRWIRSKCGWTPFDGMSVTGWPVATVIRGNIAMRDDELLGTPIGRPVQFEECLAMPEPGRP